MLLLLLCLAAVGGTNRTGVSHAAEFSYCGGQVYDDLEKCYAASKTRKLFNFNDTLAYTYSNNVCAYIVQNVGGSGLQGSGCAAGLEYFFCYQPVSVERYAFGEHLTDGSFRQLTAKARTNNSGCSSAFRRGSMASLTASPPENFDVFVDEPPVTMPSRLTGAIQQRNMSQISSQIDTSSAREIGTGMFVLPASNGSCVGRNDVGAAVVACTDAEHAGLMSAVTRGRNGYVVWGAADDSVTSVTARFADGSTASIPVDDNGFSAVFDQRALSVQL